ncbi:MAG: CRTAC1 family protein [Candidatus Latescibacterota bacterium]
MRDRPWVLLLAATAWPVICAPAAQGEPGSGVQYTDVTEQAGIRFLHTFGDEDMSSILEATGSGCMFFDYDRDGVLDLYLVNGCYLEGISDPPHGGQPPEARDLLFRGNGDGTFTDVTGAAGVGDPGYGMACLAGDYDNDGYPDIYVTNYGPNTLYHNNGDGTFSDVTAAAAVGDSLWGVGATFVDYDLDGDLDVYVGNYLDFDPDYHLSYAGDGHPGPLSYPGQPDVLYRNDGDGTFTDVTAAAGVSNESRAMGVVAGDLTGDGWPDIYVANDAMENYLYRNNGDGTFADIGLASGTAFSANGDASSSMGGDLGDYDRDGDLDLFVPDMGFNNLYRNLGGGFFEDVTAAAGIAVPSGPYVSWHGDFLDYDNDGDLDLYITNGNAHYTTHTEEALLLANVPGPDGTRVFADVSGLSGPYFRYRCVARGGAAGDYDNDGDLDLFVLNLDQPSMLLRNDGGNRRHWLQVALEGTRSNRDGIGARVRVRAGDLVHVEERLSACGYLSQNDPRLHFGLGESARVDTLTVHWPGGRVQTLVDVPADRVVFVKEPAP